MKFKMFRNDDRAKLEGDVNEWLANQQIDIKSTAMSINDVMVPTTITGVGPPRVVSTKATVVVVGIWYDDKSN